MARIWPLGRTRSALWGWKARTEAMRSATRRSTAPGAVFAPLDVEAYELLERACRPAPAIRGKSSRRSRALFQVTRLGGGVEHRNGLIQQVEAGQQQVVAAQGFWGEGWGWA